MTRYHVRFHLNDGSWAAWPCLFNTFLEAWLHGNRCGPKALPDGRAVVAWIVAPTIITTENAL